MSRLAPSATDTIARMLEVEAAPVQAAGRERCDAVTPVAPLLCTCLLAFAIGCDDDEPPTLTDRGEPYVVNIGEQFAVTLESNITTGYEWELAKQVSPDVLELISDVYLEPDSDAAGAGGLQTLTFEAVGDGSTFIELWYVQPWEDPLDPIDRARFEVVVGTGAGDQTISPDDPDEPAAPIPDDEGAITVAALLVAMPDGDVVVTGALFDDGSGLVLCEALAESFPPQCPGDRVTIAKPDDVIAAFTESGSVRRTDRPVVLLGTLVDGDFRVSA